MKPYQHRILQLVREKELVRPADLDAPGLPRIALRTTLCLLLTLGGIAGAAASPRALGMPLPAGLNARDIVALIAPDQAPASASLVGARAWPHPRGSYVAIACFPPPARTRPANCDDSNVYLGVIAFNGPGSKPALIARYHGALDIRADMDSSGASAQRRPDSYLGFDLAPYRISGHRTAFGLLSGWLEPYAGGGHSTRALALFSVDGNTVSNIFTATVYDSEIIAGDWNQDGTRQHDESETVNILQILPGKTAGYFDLLLKEQGGSAQQRYRWQPASQRYLPVAR